MEHVVQIGIGIDDEAIKKTIEEDVEKAVIKKISNEIIQNMFDDKAWQGKTLSPWVKNLMKDILEENKELIIEKSIKELTQSMCRTKIVKEKIKENIEEQVVEN